MTTNQSFLLLLEIFRIDSLGIFLFACDFYIGSLKVANLVNY